VIDARLLSAFTAFVLGFVLAAMFGPWLTAVLDGWF
jgi:hypothetical protein